MTLEFSEQILEKYLNIKFHENLSYGIRVVLCRQTGTPEETNSCILQVCKHTLKMKECGKITTSSRASKLNSSLCTFYRPDNWS